jgi:putative peptidoglycan lipid II flippase
MFKKGAAAAILIMFLSNFLSRIAGFIRTQVQAGFFGTGAHADAYAVSFLLPDTLNYILAGGCLTVTFIPVFQQLQETDPVKRDMFFSNLLNIGTALFCIFILVSFFLTPAFIEIIGGKNLGPDERQLSVYLTRIILPAQLFFFWGALLRGVQFARRRFFIPALAPIVYNMGIIIFGVTLYSRMGVAGFSVGVLAGAFLANTVLQLYGMKSTSITYYPVFNLKDPNLRRWVIKTLPLIIGVGFTYSNNFLIRFFGARSSDGPGSISALDYAYRLFMVFVALLGQSVASGVYPYITQLAADKKIREIENLIIPVLYKIAALLFALMWITPFVSHDLIELLFERRAFTEESTAITSRAFVAYMAGIFFFTSVFIMNRLYYAVEKTLTPTVISTISVALALPFFIILSRTWGVVGVALPAAIFSGIAFFCLTFYWRILYPQSQILSVYPSVLKLAILTSAGGLASFLLKSIPAMDGLPLVVRLGIVGGIPFAGMIYLFDKRGIVSLGEIVKKFRASS